MKLKKDAVHSDERTATFFRGLDVVCESAGVDFFALEVEGQEEFLNEKFHDIVEECVRIGGEEYVQFYNFIPLIVENEGCAVIYFSKRKQ